MEISDRGIALIREFEGCVLKAYPDPGSGGDPWTIGIGHTQGVVPGMVITDKQADEFLREDLAGAEIDVAQIVKVPLVQGQYDALVSFVFNLGRGNLANSTLLKMLNAGQYIQASAQFPRWNQGPNGTMPGLTRRRNAERALFDEMA